jgi:hypothetical protein
MIKVQAISIPLLGNQLRRQQWTSHAAEDLVRGFAVAMLLSVEF